MKTQKIPRMIGLTETRLPYFPAPDREPHCELCEYRDACPNAGGLKRKNRSFTVPEGRCPRLPNQQGSVDPQFLLKYRKTFPLVRVEREPWYSQVKLYLVIPDVVHDPALYRESGRWVIREGHTEDGRPISRVIALEREVTPGTLRAEMAERSWTALWLRCNITDRRYTYEGRGKGWKPYRV